MAKGITHTAIALPTTPVDWARWFLGTAIFGLVYYAFLVQPVEGQLTCYHWLRGHWRNVSNYSHGPLIPLIVGLLIWLKWDDLRRVRLAPLLWGAWVVFLGIGVYYLGVKAIQPRIVVFSLVILLYGLTLALGGRDLWSLLFFPITFLLLMIPLNFLDEAVGLPLQHFMARASAIVLNLVGIEAVRIGTSIRSAVFDFDVANPCSGIRSLMALTTVTAAFAYVTQNTLWKRWALFLSAIPLAVLGNLARVLGIALVGQVYGRGAAMRVHDYSGPIIFGVALTAMVAFGFLLNLPYRRVLANWLKPMQAGAAVNAPLASALSKETHERI